MPFGEVMYRCNANYCFSSVFRNRVVGLVITLVLMQLFLFSFYLNGLHSQAIVTATHTISSSSAGLVFNNEKQGELLPAPAPHIDGPIEDQYDSIKNLENHPGSSSTIQEYSSSQRSEAAASVDFLNSKSRAALGEAAKKAFNHMVANNKSTLDLVAMAAKKFSDPIDPMTKLGFNLLFNAINRKGQEERETPENDALNSNSVSNLSPSTDKSKDKTKLQYANLAQKSLQFLTNGIDSSSIKGGLDSGMLEMALQFMMQNSKLSKANFDPQTAKSVLSFLMNAMGNQKLEPKLLISLASKLMQSQQPTAGQHGGDMGLNLLSQMLSNGQLTSILLNGARAMQSVDSNDMSKSIYRNYLKQSSKKAPSFKSKNNLNRSVSKNKLGLDLNFRYSKEQNDYVCKKKGANSTIHLVMVISSADKKMERQVARETWISDFNNLSNRVKVVFFITSTNDISQDKSIREEAEEYHDIVQIYLDQSRQDEGHSLITTLAGFNWINKNCPGVKQILKIDDDIYVSSSKMLKIMENVNSGLSITGNIVSHLNPKTVEKYSNTTWPLDEFPTFALSGAYLLGRQTLSRLLANAEKTPIFPLEEVFIGLCAAGGDIKFVSNKSLYQEEISDELEVCTFEDFGSWRSTDPTDVRQTWKFAQTMKRSGEICVKTNKCTRMIMGLCIP